MITITSYDYYSEGEIRNVKINKPIECRDEVDVEWQRQILLKRQDAERIYLHLTHTYEKL